jgi:hypothetical protein
VAAVHTVEHPDREGVLAGGHAPLELLSDQQNQRRFLSAVSPVDRRLYERMRPDRTITRRCIRA